jgi:hypothetical protein
MADKYLTLAGDGLPELKAGTVVSTGATNAGDIPAADASGRLDQSWLPIGVGADTFTAVASETLSAGDFVNTFSNSGVFSARKADNSNGRPAQGFVLAAASATQTATIYHLGEANTALSGLTGGVKYFLVVAGVVIATPLDKDDADNAGFLSQYLGFASGATALLTVQAPPVKL